MIALTKSGRLEGLTAPLTASEALDLEALSGREIIRVALTDAAYRESLIARGTPAMWADMFVGLFAASRKGGFAAVDPTLPRLLARPPVSMRDFLVARIASKPS